MLVNVIFLVVGLALLLGGGDVMVRGASALARVLGISPLVIGLTVVAFGTSAPELAVNVLAALRGSGDLSFGNIVGSNLANIGLILGVAAIVRPLDVRVSLTRREIPFMIVVSALALGMAFDPLVFGSDRGSFGRADGAILLLGFVLFLAYTGVQVRRQRASDELLRTVAGGAGEGQAAPRARIAPSLLMTVGGLAALLYGGHLTVESAVRLARDLGVPELIIGLTVVAVGTSLPELATAVVATLRGHPDIAVGNVVGSNLFNLLFVLGLTSVICPVGVPTGGILDLVVMVGLAIVLLPIALTSSSRITRAEGLGLLAIYVAYLVWRSVASM